MSEPGPWTADHVFGVEDAARAIRAARPELEVDSVRLLGSGWDFDAYEAEGRWVFRFPRRAGEVERLAKERALLGWLGEALPIPVPRYAGGLLEAPACPYAFAAYPKLEGRNASTVSPDAVDRTAVGHALGAAFRALHDLQPPMALRADLIACADGSGPADRRTRIRPHGARLVAEVGGDLGARAKRFLEDDGLLPPPHDEAPCVIHDDLHAEHLLLDPGDLRRITGLLDWGDACIADPARDFAPIYPWGGDELLDAMLTGYGRAADEAFRARCRYLGTLVCFTDWRHWRRVGHDAGVAWTLEVLDDALSPTR